MSDFLSLDPNELTVTHRHALLLGGVAPRPIALVSSIDRNGTPNLSPYSFFNVFGSNPPLAIFSPARRVRDNSTKDTLRNAQETGEVVIHTVNWSMVQQVSLASGEYEPGVNEFLKAGFTPIPSLKVKPPRVKESPFQMECKVRQIIQTGSEGGAGNLILCEILHLHIHQSVLDEQERIDPFKLDAVARAGGNWYLRAQGNSLFEVPKPNGRGGLGIDALPDFIKNSVKLTGNHLARLGNLASFPSLPECLAIYHDASLQQWIHNQKPDLDWESLAMLLLESERPEEAYALLISTQNRR